MTKNEAIKELKKILKPNSKVYTTLEHVSRSGMMREIRLFAVHKGEIVPLTFYVKHVLGLPIGKHYGLKIKGCGMDVGSFLVYDLGRTLWFDGTRKPHGTRNGKPDTDGGYALRHVWL